LDIRPLILLNICKKYQVLDTVTVEGAESLPLSCPASGGHL